MPLSLLLLHLLVQCFCLCLGFICFCGFSIYLFASLACTLPQSFYFLAQGLGHQHPGGGSERSQQRVAVQEACARARLHAVGIRQGAFRHDTDTSVHTQICTCGQVCTLTNIRTRTCTCKHAHMHACTQAHAYTKSKYLTLSHSLCPSFPLNPFSFLCDHLSVLLSLSHLSGAPNGPPGPQAASSPLSR